MWRMDESERQPTAKADRARRSACNGHRDVRTKSIEVDGAKINHPLRAISAAPRLLGQRRARCVQSSCETPRDVWPLASRVSPLHIGSEKKFYVPCTHCRRTKLCHTIPLAASTSNSLARAAQPSVRVMETSGYCECQLGPRAIHRCARVLSR